MNRSAGYRPALDGMRAIAVLAVLLFHAGVPGIGGGFLGVDAFFVLSGYLITSLLLAERARSGRIDLRRFWVRRARRILPALLAVLVAVVVAGHFRLDPDALGLLRGDAYAALGYLANWRMIDRGTGYAAVTAAPSPLQHTWSLGIEEQFYLVWPIVVALLARWRRALLTACAVGAVVSAGLCAWLFRPDDVARAYYGTDTRAQALLIGAAVALVAARGRALGWVGAAGAAVTVWLWHAGSDQAWWMYRGGFGVAALAAAAMVVAVVGAPRSIVARGLGAPPLAWVGRISYGIYLWHWPVFAFVTADATGLPRWPLLVVRIGGTFGLAAVSYYLVEQPIRRGELGRLLPRLVPAGVTVATFGMVAGVVALATAVPPAPTTTWSAAAPPVIIYPGPAPARKHPLRVTFFGDSVSWVIGTYLPPHPGMWTSVRAIEGCGIATLPDILELGTPHTNYPGCTSWPARWQRGVKADRPGVAVIELNRWELMDRRYQGRYQHVGEPAYDAYLSGQLDLAIRIAGSRGAAVVLLTAAYTHRAERPDGGLYPEDQPQRVDAWNALLRAAAARDPAKVTVLDIDPVVCPQGKFTWRVGGIRIRSDGLHYTPAGVQRVIAPWLLPRLAAVADGTAPAG